MFPVLVEFPTYLSKDISKNYIKGSILIKGYIKELYQKDLFLVLTVDQQVASSLSNDAINGNNRRDFDPEELFRVRYTL
jgi:hypothetical protein